MKSYIQMDWRPPSSWVPGGLQLRLNMKTKLQSRISFVYFGHFKGTHARDSYDKQVSAQWPTWTPDWWSKSVLNKDLNLSRYIQIESYYRARRDSLQLSNYVRWVSFSTLGNMVTFSKHGQIFSPYSLMAPDNREHAKCNSMLPSSFNEK
jgi:hypothetical protein